MNYNQQRLGANIRALRKKKRWSMKDLAEYANITPSFLGLVERGERGLSLENVCKLCSIFSITIDDLVTKDYSGESRSAKETSRSDLDRQIGLLLPALNEGEKKFALGVISLLKVLREDAAKETSKNTVKYRG